jgi:hypothetical protein
VHCFQSSYFSNIDSATLRIIHGEHQTSESFWTPSTFAGAVGSECTSAKHPNRVYSKDLSTNGVSCVLFVVECWTADSEFLGVCTEKTPTPHKSLFPAVEVVRESAASIGVKGNARAGQAHFTCPCTLVVRDATKHTGVRLILSPPASRERLPSQKSQTSQLVPFATP